MKRIAAFGAVTAVAAGSLMWPLSAVGQTTIPPNPRIHVQYAPPQSPQFTAIRQRLMDRKILEEYSQVLSPVRLPEDLIVSTEECPDARVNSDYCRFADRCRPDTGAPHAHYIRICYEYLAMIQNESAVPNDRLPPELALGGAGLLPGFTRDEVVIGGTAFVLMHETGHAIFDLQGIPRLGHEEDAADQFAGFMMLQFGAPTALTMVKGAINVDHTMRIRHGFALSLMEDVHSLDDQRLANILCLAYGSQLGAVFTGLAGILPEARRSNCQFEYKVAETAFEALDIDKPLFEKVQRMPILASSDQMPQTSGDQKPQTPSNQNWQTLRVAFGDTMDKVRAAYGVSGEPTNDCDANDPCLVLEAPAEGLTFFFKVAERLLYEIRADPPFAGSIEGVRIGDAVDDVIARLGQPLGPPFEFGGNQAYVFAVGSGLLRCDFDDSSKCVVMFYFER